MALRNNISMLLVGSIFLLIASSRNGFVSSQRLDSSVERSEERGIYRPVRPSVLLEETPSIVRHGTHHRQNNRSHRYLQSKGKGESGSKNGKSESDSKDGKGGKGGKGGSKDNCRSADSKRRGRRMLGSKSQSDSNLPLCTPSPTSAAPTPPPTMIPTSATAATPRPTSVSPTSSVPTTPAPTTAPSTASPSTGGPAVSGTPTTAGPTVTPVTPTTVSPTIAPTTAPTTAAPTTASPTTVAPTTGSPTTPNPTASTTLAALTRDGTTVGLRSEGCVEKLFNLNMDIQIHFPSGFLVACNDEAEEISIMVNVKEALKQNFPTTVSDWQGTVVFGDFLFDIAQVQDNSRPEGRLRARALLAGVGGGLGLRTDESRRSLQETTCPARTVDCSETVADYCRWGCIGVAATDCGSPHSPTKSWTLLAEDIRSRLAGLGYKCLGLADELNVVVTEPNLAQL